jgi:hypothetical protein
VGLGQNSEPEHKKEEGWAQKEELKFEVKVKSRNDTKRKKKEMRPTP